MQVYDTPRAKVVHADLYRLRGAGELTETGLAEELEDAIGLIEWPDRAGDLIDPAARLDVVLELDPAAGDGARRVVLIPARLGPTGWG